MKAINKLFVAGCLGMLAVVGASAQDTTAVTNTVTVTPVVLEKPFTWTLQD